MAGTIKSDIEAIAKVLDAGGKTTAPIRVHTSDSTLKKAKFGKGEGGGILLRPSSHRDSAQPAPRQEREI
jgi:hypothetical protein